MRSTLPPRKMCADRAHGLRGKSWRTPVRPSNPYLVVHGKIACLMLKHTDHTQRDCMQRQSFTHTSWPLEHATQRGPCCHQTPQGRCPTVPHARCGNKHV